MPELVTKRRRMITIDKEQILDTIRSDAAMDIQGRAEWADNHQRRMEKFRMMLPEHFGLFEDSYDVNIPIMMTTTQRLGASLINAALSGNPLANARGRGGSTNKQSERRVESALESLIRFDMDGEQVIDDFVMAGLTTGTGLKKVSMDYIVRQEKQVHTFGAMDDNNPVGPQIQVMLERIYGVQSGKDAWTIVQRSEDWNTIKVKRIDTNRLPGTEEIEDIVEFYPEDHSTAVEVIGERVWKRQPKWEIIPVEDLLVPTNATGVKIGEAQHAIHVTWVDLSFLRENRNTMFNMLSDEDLAEIESMGVPGTQSGEIAGEDTEERRTFDEIEGIDRLSGLSETANNRFPLWECYYSMDLDGDGYDEEVIIWIVPRSTGWVCGAKYLSEVFPSGERPISMWRPISLPDRFYGIGIPELVEGLSDLIHAMEIQSLDVLALSAMPLLFYRATAGMRPETIRYTYGQMFPVDNPQQDISAVTMRADHRGFTDHISLLQSYMDRLVVLSNLNFGGIPEGGSSALRTARSTLAVLGQADVSAERFLRRLFRGLSDSVKQTYSLVRHFMPKDKQYRRFGFTGKDDDPFVVLDKIDLDADYIFSFEVNTLSSNKAVMREISQLMLQVLIQPLAIQTGAVDMNNIHNILEFFLRNHEIQDVDRFIKRPENFIEPIPTPEEQIARLLRGEQELKPHPLGQLQVEMELIKQLMGDPEAWISIPPEVQQEVEKYATALVQALSNQNARNQLAQLTAGFQQNLAAAEAGGSPAGQEPGGFTGQGGGSTGTNRRAPAPTKPR